MGFAEKLGVWVPHELSENNKENRLQIASQHLTCHQATCSHKQMRNVPIYKYEAKKGMGGSWRYAKAES